jgi:hypothetical protein
MALLMRAGPAVHSTVCDMPDAVTDRGASLLGDKAAGLAFVLLMF